VRDRSLYYLPLIREEGWRNFTFAEYLPTTLSVAHPVEAHDRKPIKMATS